MEAPWVQLVDPTVAGRVAEAILGAPTVHPAPAVRAAYDRLGEEARAWFARLTSPASPSGVRVVFTRCPEPYADASELADAVGTDRLLEIHSAAYEPHRRHPLLDSGVGGTFDQLRAVHDIVSHGCRRFSFDRDGEFSAWLAEEPLYSPPARRALATELHGQHSVLWTTGALAELKATVLPAAVLRATRCQARRSDAVPTAQPKEVMT